LIKELLYFLWKLLRAAYTLRTVTAAGEIHVAGRGDLGVVCGVAIVVHLLVKGRLLAAFLLVFWGSLARCGPPVGIPERPQEGPTRVYRGLPGASCC
jgi:hypothetical protein